MVTHKRRDRRWVAAYPLSDVHDRARNEQVTYAGLDVSLDTDAIGYELDDVCGCLLKLTPQQFQHSDQYYDVDSWHDVYRITEVGPDGISRDLYIKFKFFGERLVLLLCSFHP